MTVLAADRNTLRKEPGIKTYPVAASTKIYMGSIVAINGVGLAVPASDTANLIVVGVATELADNSSGAASAINVKVETGIFKFAATSIQAGDVGRVMYVVDDQTFDDDPVNTQSVVAGKLVERVGNTEGWLWIASPRAHTITQANAGSSYTAAEQSLLNELKNSILYYV